MLDSLVAALFGLAAEDLGSLLVDCDLPSAIVTNNTEAATLDPRGFWRIDKHKDPELRHTVLTLVAFHDLQRHVEACDGDRERGIEAFLTQNDGEGWLLPETLRLADYGLGHEHRAQEPQPVASRLGPRFYDWQLAQSPDESWRECHLHARNLLGKSGYLDLLGDTLLDKHPSDWAAALTHASDLKATADLLHVFAPPLARCAADAWRLTLEAVSRLVTSRGLPFDTTHRAQLIERGLDLTFGAQRQPALLAALELLSVSEADAVLTRFLSGSEKDSDTAWCRLIRASVDPQRFSRLSASTSTSGAATQASSTATPPKTSPTAKPNQTSLFPEGRP